MAKLACVIAKLFSNQRHEACKALLKVSFGQRFGNIIVRSENFTLQCYLIELLHATIPPRKHTTGEPFISALFKESFPVDVWKNLPNTEAATQSFFQYIKNNRKMLKKG